ncbi:MAG TPA: hypothetical protein VI997_03905 [Candidatus Thermoplasmatota archaeon]|nr:hypothetical protein [Candidatus Thermoplasmatota archaeon]
MRFRVLLALLALSGGTAAHATVDEGAVSASVGGWFLWFRTLPSTVYEDEPFLVNLGVNHAGFSPGTGLLVAASGPAGPLELRENQRGSYVATVTVAEPGPIAVAFTLPDANGTGNVTWTANVSVYKDVGVSIAPADALADFTENVTSDVAVLVLERGTSRPDPRVKDLQIRFEHWSDDHKRLLGADVVAARSAEGAWHATYGFPGRGMYHLRFASASLGLDYADAPYVHLYATPPFTPPGIEEPANDSPAVGAAVVAAVAGTIAAARRRQG